MFKHVADTLVHEAGITPMLHLMFVAPIMDGNTIKGVITESKAGRKPFSQSVLLMQPATLMWLIEPAERQLKRPGKK